MNKDAGGKPTPTFSILSTIAVMVGVVVGIGIFRLPSIVAQNAAGTIDFLLFWVFGGLISLFGALCYAEIAAAHPNAGGEYHFLYKGFGSSIAFLFSWGRMTVIQTGSIGLAAFILGDYASLILHLGPHSSAIYAAITVILLTTINILGTGYSRNAQNTATFIILGSLVLLAVIGGFKNDGTTFSTTEFLSTPQSGFGSAMIFVLLTYGGWNEAVYLSAELKDVRKNMSTVLIAGIGIITTIYVAVNFAYVNVLGLEGVQNTDAIGVALVENIFGGGSSIIMALIVIFAALSTANATIITGARTNYALGRDFEILKYLGRWNGKRNAPQNALLIQGIITLLLILLGTFTKEAVSTMVDYTAPVFWLFLLLTTSTLFIFRKTNSVQSMPYKVPFYPITPILFILACAYMLYSSILFTGTGAVFGIGVLLLGIPVLVWNHQKYTVSGNP